VFHVKICGVTVPADARLAADAGADAIGLNFVPGSPRCLDVATARAVAAAVPEGVLTVGVFAGGTADFIRAVAREVGLAAVQLHGHLGGDGAGVDPPELCGALSGLRVIRAVRLEPAAADPLSGARRWLAEAAALGWAPELAIVDSAVPAAARTGQLGGTGGRVDWTMLAGARPLPVPIALAGGLGPDNVAAAIAATGVRAVDTASGVESSPGRKDAARVRAFVAAARRALGLAG
jgi:phosphoribosylanthranilate isomerase